MWVSRLEIKESKDYQQELLQKAFALRWNSQIMSIRQGDAGWISAAEIDTAVKKDIADISACTWQPVLTGWRSHERYLRILTYVWFRMRLHIFQSWLLHYISYVNEASGEWRHNFQTIFLRSIPLLDFQWLFNNTGNIISPPWKKVLA